MEAKQAVLPQDVLFYQILVRLPVNSLMRLKCVSKSWSSLIRDPSFVTGYKKLHCQRKTTRLLFHCEGYFFSSQIDHQGNPTPVSHLSSIKPYNPNFQHCYIQSINGLVCAPNKYYPVVIFNPGTRESMKLPHGATFGSSPEHHFGFCPNTNEYKVLQINNEDEKLSFQIFTLGADSWRPLEEGLDDLPINFRCWHHHFNDNRSVYIQGSIYWMHEQHNSSTSIVVFDVGDEKFRVIPLPEEYDWPQEHDYARFASRFHISPGIVELGGCPAAFGPKSLQRSQLVLWILKDCKNHVWVKETIILRLREAEGYHRADRWYFQPLCPIHTGELAIAVRKRSYSTSYGHGPPQVHLYDMESKGYTIHDFDYPESVHATFDEYPIWPVDMSLVCSYDDSIVPLK